MTEMGNECVWRADELEDVRACPICQAQAQGGYRYQQMHDLLESLPGEWAFRQCCRCESLFLDPRPNVASIQKAYSSYFTHSSGTENYVADNGESFFWKLANGYMNAKFGSRRSPALGMGKLLVPLIFPLRQQLDYFYRVLPRTQGRVLDIGCGNGVFLLRAKAAGWEAVGFEPDPVAAQAVRQSGFKVYERDLGQLSNDGLFDVITLSHVIEHVHEPLLFMEQIRGLLKSGGQLWLATPNISSPGHRWYGRSWLGLDPPRHLALFSPNALRELLNRAGYSDIRFRCRGRGAASILRKSLEFAQKEGLNTKKLPPLFVDLMASISPAAGEECIVTATKQS
jgi:2-polyprenyl-3-methyl-5-hydroxy-6-metoxy-1,4-benzoquinol methylase